jgi:hypothetical protein
MKTRGHVLERGRGESYCLRMSIEQIEKEALALPGEARARLADRLVESLEAPEFGRIDKLWAVEAKRRRELPFGDQCRADGVRRHPVL